MIRGNGENLLMERPAYLKPETVRAIVTAKFKSSKTKFSLKTAKYLSACFNCLIQEAILRSGQQCISEGSEVVTSDIVQKVITQLTVIPGMSAEEIRTNVIAWARQSSLKI